MTFLRFRGAEGLAARVISACAGSYCRVRGEGLAASREEKGIFLAGAMARKEREGWMGRDGVGMLVSCGMDTTYRFPPPLPVSYSETQCTFLNSWLGRLLGFVLACLLAFTLLVGSGLPCWIPSVYSLFHPYSKRACGHWIHPAHRQTNSLSARLSPPRAW